MRNKARILLYFMAVVLIAYTQFNTTYILNAEKNNNQINSISKIINSISTDKGYELILNNAENPEFQIIDVRTPGEFADGHIKNAVNIDFLSPTFKDELGGLDKKKTYVIHCRSGGRSSKALNIMDEMGFQNVYNIGGIIDWEKKGYPVVK